MGTNICKRLTTISLHSGKSGGRAIIAGNLGWLKDWALDGEIPTFSKNGKRAPEPVINPEKEAEEEAALELERERVRKLFEAAGLVPAQEEANVNQS